MADFTRAQLLTRFNTRLHDSTDTTFASSEKEEFVDTALQDENVYQISRDTSLTSDATTADYELPDNFRDPLDVGFDLTGDDFRISWISRDYWRSISGVLYFDEALYPLPDNKTIVLIAKEKLNPDSESYPDYLADYILTSASIEAHEFLKANLATRFLKNDMTMGDLVTALQSLRAKQEGLRANLPNITETSF